MFYESELTRRVSLLLLAVALIGMLTACGHRMYQLPADKATFDSKNIAIIIVNKTGNNYIIITISYFRV